MRRFLLFITIVITISHKGYTQSYGLGFNSHEVEQEKRTSLDLSPDDSICFNQDMRLDFELRFMPGYAVYFGYILRIIEGNKQNLDLIYNQKSKVFQLITGENFKGEGFTIDSALLFRSWNRFSLQWNLQTHILQLFVNDSVVIRSGMTPSSRCFRFLWGANEFGKFTTRDIPPMQIKDIRLFEQKKLQYYWPLDEITGTTCIDRQEHRKAAMVNPVWIKPGFQQWNHVASFKFNGYAGVAFDPRKEQVFVTGSDSLAVFTAGNREQLLTKFYNPHHEFVLGHQAVYDTLYNQLYDVFADQKKLFPYNLSAREWAPQEHHDITEYWHMNKMISPLDSSLYLFGGYGQLRYKNLIQRYSLVTRQWDTIKPTGDYFSPRYLAGLGTDATGRYAYIIGGYGSKSGDQMLDPGNNYELFRFDILTHNFTRIYSFHPSGMKFVFGNSLVIDKNASDYYGFIFPNDSFKTSLQLIKGSLKDSSFQLVASQIPFNFHDIRSFADLYYAADANKLIAVTLLYTKEEEKFIQTEVNIYSLDFPPGELLLSNGVNGSPGINPRNLWIVSGLILLIVTAGIYAYIKKRKKQPVVIIQPEVNEPEEISAETETAGSPTFFPASGPLITSHYPAIYLFGQFQVIDSEGQEITRLFTPLLKELFLIILVYSFSNKRGISSEGLNEILWHDKSPKDAMNNRSVNINKLKAILEKLGNCVINKDSGIWQFQVQEDKVYVDYKQFSLLALETNQEQGHIKKLSAVIHRGPLLAETEYNWLDNIKSEVSHVVIEHCIYYLKNYYPISDTELVLDITTCIFYFDRLNEEALRYKCKALISLKRYSLAKSTYANFVKEYKISYGEKFKESFEELIGGESHP